MRQLLIILLLFITVGALAQVNPNSATTAYQSLSSAIKYPKDEGWKVDVMDNGTIKHYITVLRSKGFVPNGGTIIACADSISALLLDQSQASGINLSWFLKPINGTDTTDNYAKLQWLFSSSCPYNHFIWDKAGVYYTTRLPDVQKYIKVEGPDGYEVPTNTVYLYVPQATTSLAFNNANSAGSYLKGFGIYSKLPESGRILEYNPNNGTMLYIAPITPLTAGKTFEFRDSYYPDKVLGTAVISNPGAATIVSAVEYVQPSGTFQIGDTIKGTTSGAKATVRFVSRIHNALAVGVITGTFKANETITGTSSGVTAKFYAVPVPARWGFAKVATMSNVSGLIDNPQNGTGNTTDSSILNADTLQFAVTGNIDSLGASGKRQNIFVEAGKYSVGITINRRITLEDMTVTGFGGDGIYISNITTPVSNANLTRLNRVRSNANAGNGIRINGGDANHISLENSTFVNNAAWGICDISFLGIAVNTVHTSVDMVGGGTTGTYINRKSTWLNFYSEGAYNGMDPWQPAENSIGGASTKIGGTDGLANHTPYWSTAGNGGSEYSNHLKNNEIYTDISNAHDPIIVLKSTGGITHNITVENQGTPSVGRGGTYGFRSPYGAGYQGADIKGTALDMGNILGSQATGSTYGVDFFLRRNVPPTMTVTGGSGTGAVVQVDILNGKATKVNVLAGGKKYPLNGTTVTAANFPNTTFIPYIEDSVIKAVIIQGDSSTSNGDNDIYSVAQILSNGTLRPTVNKGGSLGDATHHWAVVYADSIVSAGTASNQYIWNQKATQQAGDFYIGTTGSIITNHSAVTATPNSNIINSGLNVIARSGADGYYSPFHVYMNGAASGMHFNTWGSNNTSISGGGYARQLANGILGGYFFGDNQISAIAFNNGTIHYLLGNNTAGAIAPLTDVGGIDTTGMYTFIPKASATDAFIARRIIGANTNEIRAGGSDGRTLAAFQNGVLSSMNFNATQFVYNANLKIAAQKALVFSSYDGTNTGYGVFNTDASGNFYLNVNSINAIMMTSTGRTVFGGAATLKSYTVATLPASPFTGDVVLVTDASSPANGTTVVGGGTTKVPVYFNAANWIVMGAAGSGTNFWQRNGTIISPLTAGDNISTTGTGIFNKVKVTGIATGTNSMKPVMWDSADSTLKSVSATASSAIDQTYTGTFTSDGTVASSPVSLKYSWSSDGKFTTLKIRFKWNTPSGNMTTVSFPLPGDCPAPSVPSDVTGDQQIITTGNVALQPSNNASMTVTDATKLVLKKLSTAPSGFTIETVGNTFSYQGLFITLIYQNQ